MSSINTSDLTSVLERAVYHSNREEYGRACSFYLLLFYQDKDYCRTLKVPFLHAFCEWVREMVAKQNFDQISCSVKTAVEMYRPKVDIVLAVSQIFQAEEYLFEALQLLTLSHRNQVTSYTLVECMEHLSNLILHRWHFRMLNDKNRNRGYHIALNKAYEDGHRQVLDLGSGTGLFSMMAARVGFTAIVSCEISEIMCDIQKKCVAGNGLSERIDLVKTFSTDLELEKHFSAKPTLVVTELFDCALLGEGVLPSLLHCWDHLLNREEARIIPHSAIIYGVCVECREIRRHSKFPLHPNNKNKISSDGDQPGINFKGGKDPGDLQHQPYTTEHMATIKGGYTQLSTPFIVKQINFNEPGELRRVIGSSHRLEVSIARQGVVDGVMVYFVLNIDEDSASVSTLDDDGLCWEQAIYSFPDTCYVQPNDTIKLDIFCHQDYLDINMVEEGCSSFDLTLDQVGTLPVLSGPLGQNFFNIDRRLVARLNDELYGDKYRVSILQQLQILQKRNSEEQINVCFICSQMSTLPILFSSYEFVTIYLLNPSNGLRLVMEKQISTGSVKCISRTNLSQFSTENIVFHIVVSEAVNCDGLLKENIVEDLTILKLNWTSSETVYIPSEIHCHGCLISSDRLVLENRVVDDNIPLQLNIGEFINDYRVNIHPDVNGLTLMKKSLSNEHRLMMIDLSAQLSEDEIESFSFSENRVMIPFVEEGVVTGLMFWFEMLICEGEFISTKPCVDTHWHQACSIFPQCEVVKKGDVASLKISRNGSNFHFITSLRTT